MDIPLWFVILVYLPIFGIGATLSFVSTYVVLRPLARSNREQEHSPSRVLGFSNLGALAGGVANFLPAWLLAYT